MNFDEFDAVFDRFQATAFRLETLPRYADDEDEEFAVFLTGRYEANVDAGEDVRVADRGVHPELAVLRRDFWLFDAETPDALAMPMHHDTAGHLVGFDTTDDPQVIEQCRRERDLAVALSVPLHEYAAALDT